MDFYWTQMDKKFHLHLIGSQQITNVWILTRIDLIVCEQ